MTPSPAESPAPESVRTRLEERNRDDWRQAWLLLLLGLPFAAGAILFMSVGLFLLFILLPLDFSWTAKYLIGLALVLVAVLIDVIRHPSEHWHHARYYLTDGSVSDAVAGGVSYLGADGWFAGMPAMTSVTDPHNLAERGRVISSGCANVVLGGPRTIRKGIEEFLLVRNRSHPQTVAAAEEVVRWLGERPPVNEADAADAVARRPLWKKGIRLAQELGFVVFPRTGSGRLMTLRSDRPSLPHET